MADDQKYDVHRSVGLWFICGCIGLGFLVGAILPIAADRAGIIHLGKMAAGIYHIDYREALLDGTICSLFGAINGVLLAINQRLWFMGILAAALPCGIFGGCAAMMTPHPYSQGANAVTFWTVPFLITLLCVLLRNAVWTRYQKPVVGISDHAGKNTKRRS